MEDLVQKHKKKILIAAGLAAAGAVIWTVLSRRKKDQNQTGDKGSDQDTAKDSVDKDIKQIRIVTIAGITGRDKILSKETLIAIHSLIAKRLTAKYIEKAVETRKERRQHIDDIKQYIKDCEELHAAYAKLIQSITAKILIDLKLDPNTYQTAFEYHTQKEANQDWLDRAAQADPGSISSDVKLTKDRIQKIYSYQLGILEQVVRDLATGLGANVNAESLDYLVDFRLADLTAISEGIEEEDWLNKHNASLKDLPYVQALDQEVQQKKLHHIARLC